MSNSESRFWAKVDLSEPDGCWPWTAFKNPKGYGYFYVGGKVVDVVTKLRELSPLYEMAKEGVDLTKVVWTAHS